MRIIQVRKSNKNNLKTVPAFVTDIEDSRKPKNVIHKICRIVLNSTTGTYKLLKQITDRAQSPKKNGG